jgi:hypothetical protein
MKTSPNKYSWYAVDWNRGAYVFYAADRSTGYLFGPDYCSSKQPARVVMLAALSCPTPEKVGHR